MEGSVKCENVFIIDEEAECDKKAQLVDRIRQQRAIAKKQRVKNVLRKGISTPTEEELSRIREHRERLINMMTLRRQMADVRRQRDEWREYISHKRENYSVEQVTQAAAEASFIEGRAFIFLPLLALFRIMLCNNRARRRLEKLRTRHLSHNCKMLISSLQTQPVIEAVSTTEEHLMLMPVSYSKNNLITKQFLMTELFIPRPLCKPFVFALNDYQMERLPEFSVDLSAAVAKEYAVYAKSDHSEPSAITLVDFVQPLVTLETFDLPKRAYGAVSKRSLLHTRDSFDATAGRTQSSIYRKAQEKSYEADHVISSVGGLSQELNSLGLPQKLAGPISEDSLSDSEIEETQPSFQADISWLPFFATEQNDANELSLRPPEGRT